MKDDDWKQDLLNLTAQTAREQTEAARLAQLEVDKGVVGKALLECLKQVRNAISQAKCRAYVKQADLGQELSAEQSAMLQGELRRRGFQVHFSSHWREPDPNTDSYVIEWDSKPVPRQPYGAGAHLLETTPGTTPA